jgi:hypothetical protein
MKTLIRILPIFIILFAWNPSGAAEPKAGEEVHISSTVNDDLYLAGKNVTVSAKVNGDVVAAGANVQVSDTVFGDAILAGGDVGISGFVTDDIRIAGGDIEIFKGAGSDVLVFGGTVIIHEGALIRGDLIVFGGDVEINGKIEGELTVFSGNVKLNADVADGAEVKCGSLYVNGHISGDSEIAAEDLVLGPSAKFSGTLRYWTRDGETNFGPAAENAIYDPSLELAEDTDHDPSGLEAILGGIGFVILSFFSSVLIILILVFVFGKYFKMGGERVEKELFKNFGFGVLYVIAIPVLIMTLLISVIGIPIALLVLVLYIFTLVFAPTISSVLVANYINHKYQRDWNNWLIVLVSSGVLIVLGLLIMIPFVGWLIGILVIGASFGAILSSFNQKNVGMSSETQ